MGFPLGLSSKESTCNAGGTGSIPGSGRSPGEGNGWPTPVLLPGKSHGQRSLAGCSPWGHNGSDTEQLNWLTGTVARVGLRIRPWTQKWKPHIGFSSSARRKCSSTQRKKGVAFNATTTLRPDFPRTRKSEDHGLASVKCWKANNHQHGILYPTKTLFERQSKIKTFRANGNETTHHPHTWTKINIKAVLWKKEK